jgi:hypothetical protein
MPNLALPFYRPFIDPEDLRKIGKRVSEINPEIQLYFPDVEKKDPNLDRKLAGAPLLTVEFCKILGFEPPRGPWFRSVPVHKAAQLRVVENAGLNVPFWTRYERGVVVTEEEFGPYVFIKSTAGNSNGDGNVLVRTRDIDQVRPVLDRTFTGIGAHTAILQKFIDTGPYPSHFRVLLFFAHPIVSRLNVSDNLSAIYGPQQPLFAKENIASNRGSRKNYLTIEPDVLDFARQIAHQFPEKPLLALDIIRSAKTGELYFLEANIGNIWFFSARSSLEQLKQVGGPEALEAQFGAFGVCATVLSEMTTRLAA